MLPPGDAELVQIVDAAFADAARRSGDHLKCAAGCTNCCTGVFAISALDRERLREGLRLLQDTAPARAAALHRRVQESAARLLDQGFPGDPNTGMLADDEASQERFEDFANDERCPVLDPATGLCDLYAHRPVTCRTFGPPVILEDGNIGVCELCFTSATAQEMRHAAIALPAPEQEADLEQECEAAHGATLIAFALRQR